MKLTLGFLNLNYFSIINVLFKWKLAIYYDKKFIREKNNCGFI